MISRPQDLEIDATGAHIPVSDNATPKANISPSGSSWYYTTGSSAPSNPSRGDTPDALGQLVLHPLTVQHPLTPTSDPPGRFLRARKRGQHGSVNTGSGKGVQTG